MKGCAGSCNQGRQACDCAQQQIDDDNDSWLFNDWIFFTWILTTATAILLIWGLVIADYSTIAAGFLLTGVTYIMGRFK
jgi:hypothetical protein